MSGPTFEEGLAWLTGVSRRAGSEEARYAQVLLQGIEACPALPLRWVGTSLFVGPLLAGHINPEGGRYDTATRWNWYTTWTGLSEKWVSRRTAMRQLKSAAREMLQSHGQQPHRPSRREP